MSGTVWIAFFLLLGALTLELFAPKGLTEGFQLLAPKTKQSTNFLTNSFSPRGDVGVGRETRGFVQDRRYYMGFADVQRLGVKNDFCRMVTLSGDDHLMFACSLAGTSGTSPYDYRTLNMKQGFRVSRDDYMRDILKDGRDAYCRILKTTNGTYQPLCLRALDSGFNKKDELDPDPPEEIKTLLDFYSGCQMWLRLRDDMVDYVGNAVLQTAGGITIDPTPKPTITRGLSFNGIDQFVRFGDTGDLTLGNKINLRTVRAWSVWVYFDAFTNNAHIFDFGDGPGLNNIFLGILGKGETGDDMTQLRPDSKCKESTVPESPSGAQWCPELRPQELLIDPNDTACDGPSVFPSKVAPLQTRPLPKAQESGALASRATLQFEIWNQKLRKVQIKVNRAVPIQKWLHVVVTAASNDAMRPDLQVWLNGTLAFTQESGALPQTKVTSNNYLGKSNWTNASSEYELRDELFSGSIFDFRMYNTPLGETKIKRILQWGMGKLGLDNSFATATPS
jgi:hypothetical protein